MIVTGFLVEWVGAHQYDVVVLGPMDLQVAQMSRDCGPLERRVVLVLDNEYLSLNLSPHTPLDY